MELIKQKLRGPTEAKDTGLKILSKGGEDPVADIIAVHGLNGHWNKTWTSDTTQCNWLRDFLPKDLPRSRICSFGYDADTRSRDFVSDLTVASQGEKLVASLYRARVECEARPIIFVAHSLGGLVVKEALIYSDQAIKQRQNGHYTIRLSTYGVIFMGTPHLGSQLADTRGLLANVLEAVMNTNKKLLQHLQQDSESLEKQQREYGLVKRGIRAYYFYEEYETRLPTGGFVKVVPKRSAVIPEDGDAVAEGISNNHRNMVRFGHADEEGYQQVAFVLKKFAGESSASIRERWEQEPENKARLNILNLLNYDDMNLRFSKVKDAADQGVGEWLFATQQYTDWEQKPASSLNSRFLFLLGKPGSGKSVLMKSVVKRNISISAGGQKIPLYFFFDRESGSRDGGAAVSAEALYRCLLSQLVRTKVLPHDFMVKYERLPNDLRSYVGLETAMREALMHCNTSNREIRIFLDAIDECSSDRENGIWRVMEFFAHIQSQNLGTGIKFLFSSSHESNCAAYYADASVLFVEDGNASDLNKYIEKELQNISSKAISDEVSPVLALAMRQKASGSFLWAQIVLHEIKQNLSTYPGMKILEILDQIPKDLTRLYERLLIHANLPKKQETLSLLQVVCYSERSFSLSQMRQVLAILRTTGSSSKDYERTFEEFPKRAALEGHLRAITRGLIEFTRDRRQPNDSPLYLSLDHGKDELYVQFIHGTVRKYLTEGGGLATLSEGKQPEISQMGHSCMLQICLKALDYDNMKDDHIPPLRQYAGSFWMKHAGACDDISYDLKPPRFVTSCLPKTRKVVALYKQYLDSGDSEYSCDLEDEESLFVFLAAQGCTALLAKHHQGCKNANCVRKTTEVAAAATTDSSEAQDEIIETVWERAQYFASVANHVTTVRYLHDNAESTCSDGNPTLDKSTAFYMACYQGHVDIVADLLHWGADAFQLCRQPYETGLHAAAICRHLDVIEVLFESCDPERLLTLADSQSCTALHVAARYGQDDVVKLLLEKVMDTGDEERFLALKSRAGHTALQVARGCAAQNVVDVFADYVDTGSMEALAIR